MSRGAGDEEPVNRNIITLQPPPRREAA